MIIKKLENEGRILSLEETKNIKAGLVVLKLGQEVGQHITTKREEVILILSGEAEIICDNINHHLTVEQLAYIEPEKEHNVRNIGQQELKYIYLVSLFK